MTERASLPEQTSSSSSALSALLSAAHDEASGALSTGHFRTLHTFQRCAPPMQDDDAGSVLGFELACVACGAAAGGFIVWRKRRAAARAAGGNAKTFCL